jgi:putative transposase
MTPILRVVAGEARGEVRGVLDEIVAEGAPRMLAAALEAELDTYLARLARSRTSAGIRLMVLRGHAEPPTITTGAGGDRGAGLMGP